MSRRFLQRQAQIHHTPGGVFQDLGRFGFDGGLIIGENCPDGHFAVLEVAERREAGCDQGRTIGLTDGVDDSGPPDLLYDGQAVGRDVDIGRSRVVEFVKEAAEQVEGLEIGLISLTPLNPANRPRTDAEMTALLQLEKDRQRGVIGFVDGDEFKAVSADLALVRSCVDCHNQHPRAVRKNFQQWDVMGALVVRLKRRVEGEGQALPPEPPKRAPGLLEGPPPPPTITPPWVR